jgi:hypothetical protein
MKRLKVTENHIKLLKELYIGWEDCEFGAPCVDCKRPFGNSDVYGDMAEILGIKLANQEENFELYEKQIYSLSKGYKELQDCLQILCKNLSIEVGEYECDDYGTNWRKVE